MMLIFTHVLADTSNLIIQYIINLVIKLNRFKS